MILYTWSLFLGPGIFMLLLLVTLATYCSILKYKVQASVELSSFAPLGFDKKKRIALWLSLIFMALLQIFLIWFSAARSGLTMRNAAMFVPIVLSVVASSDLLTVLIYVWFGQIPTSKNILSVKLSPFWRDRLFINVLFVPRFLASALTVVLAIWWILRDVPLLQNFFAVSLISFFITKMASIPAKFLYYMLLVFLVFDAVWVFMSQYLFVDALVDIVHTLTRLPITLFLPGETIYPILSSSASVCPQLLFRLHEYVCTFMYGSWNVNTVLLGIGHVILPGSLVNVLYRHSFLKEKGSPAFNSYYAVTHLSYLCGLLLMFASRLWVNLVYPTSLILHAVTFLPPLGLAWYRGELVQVWSGEPQMAEDSNVGPEALYSFELSADELAANAPP